MDILNPRLRLQNATATSCKGVHLHFSSSMDVICPGFTQIHHLGEGGFGVVYLAKRQADNNVRIQGIARCTTDC